MCNTDFYLFYFFHHNLVHIDVVLDLLWSRGKYSCNVNVTTLHGMVAYIVLYC